MMRVDSCPCLLACAHTRHGARTVTSLVVGAPNTSVSGTRMTSPPKPRMLPHQEQVSLQCLAQSRREMHTVCRR